MIRYVRKAQLAEILNVSEETLRRWQSEGMPVMRTGSRGQSNEYDVAAVVVWLIERAKKRSRAGEGHAE